MPSVLHLKFPKEICRERVRLGGESVGISPAGLISSFNECRGTYALNAAHYLRNSRNDNKDLRFGERLYDFERC